MLKQKLLGIIKKLLLMAGVLLALTMVVLIGVKVFTVKAVVISGASNIKGKEILSNRLIFLIGSGDERKIYDKNPDLKSVRIIKKYPDSVEIVVEKDMATAYLVVNSGYYQLSAQGRITAKTSDKQEALPLITYYEKIEFSSYSVGQEVGGKDLKKALFFVSKAQELGLSIETVEFSGFDVLVLKAGEKSYFFSLSGDGGRQYNQLKTIINYLRVSGKNYQSIDVRFDKPVIKLK